MSNVIPFPTRDAGRVLAEAMEAACRAAEATADVEKARLAAEPHSRFAWSSAELDLICQQAAVNAASPIVRLLTTDPYVLEAVCHGFSEEAMIRLRKRGAA